MYIHRSCGWLVCSRSPYVHVTMLEEPPNVNPYMYHSDKQPLHDHKVSFLWEFSILTFGGSLRLAPVGARPRAQIGRYGPPDNGLKVVVGRKSAKSLIFAFCFGVGPPFWQDMALKMVQKWPQNKVSRASWPIKSLPESLDARIEAWN